MWAGCDVVIGGMHLGSGSSHVRRLLGTTGMGTMGGMGGDRTRHKKDNGTDLE